MATKFEYYHVPLSQPSRAVLLLLKLTKAPHNVHFLDMMKGTLFNSLLENTVYQRAWEVNIFIKARKGRKLNAYLPVNSIYFAPKDQIICPNTG